MKTSAELIWYQSEKRFHPRANKHRAPETASRSAIFISPPGACSSELLLTFKRLSDWRSWTPGHAVSNGLILCLHRGDISGLHMSVTEPPPADWSRLLSYRGRAPAEEKHLKLLKLSRSVKRSAVILADYWILYTAANEFVHFYIWVGWINLFGRG